MKTSIGILGGVGAIASARFHLDLVTEWARVHDAKTDDDFPIIRHVSRGLALTSEGMTDRNTPMFVQWAINDIDAEETDVIAVICNSITPALPISSKLLTPVAACADRLRGVRDAWLLASESTIVDCIYQDAYPHVCWHLMPVTAQIQQAISGHQISNPFNKETQDEFPVVLGCTELSTAHLNWPNTISPTNEMIRILCNIDR